MVKTEIIYLGDKHCDLIHVESGAKISTDAPKDNQGKGLSFSPTDLCATSLGACMLTVMAIQAESKGIDLKGSKAVVEKEMKTSPRRIGKLTVNLQMPKSILAADQNWLKDIAMNCPVKHSLHASIEVQIQFDFCF